MGAVLSAQSIRRIQPVRPFHERGVIYGKSFGLSVAGYDIRIKEGSRILPHHYVLGSSIEQFNMPNDVIAKVHDKSTWARLGLQCFNTVIEPGWRGFLTLELVNHSDDVLDIQPGSPIAQIVFEWLDEPSERPYSGKYQDQEEGPQPARLEVPRLI